MICFLCLLRSRFTSAYLLTTRCYSLPSFHSPPLAGINPFPDVGAGARREDSGVTRAAGYVKRAASPALEKRRLCATGEMTLHGEEDLICLSYLSARAQRHWAELRWELERGGGVCQLNLPADTWVS